MENKTDVVAERERQWMEEIKQNDEKSNLVGNVLFWVGCLVIAIGLVGTIAYDITLYPIIVYGMLIAGFGEIISLLQKIYLNTKR